MLNIYVQKSSDIIRGRNRLLEKKIAALRGKTSQSAFGRRFDVSHMTVSRWESGQDRPSPAILVKMARMSEAKDKWLFLSEAGIERSDIEDAIGDLPEVPSLSVTAAGLSGKRVADVIAVRVLKDPAAAGQPIAIDERDISGILLVPNSKEFAPHPDGLIAVPVRGDSMSPLLMDGYTVVVDTRDNIRSHLYDEMVCARAPEGGVTIKWLRRTEDGNELLLAQHTSPRHRPFMITGNDEWKIIGKVIWWLGRPGKKS